MVERETTASASAAARRPYRAGSRARAAAETRAAILDAALRLFVQHGYGKVTVSDIAQEAETAVPTVYASTGGKSSILSHLISEGMSDSVADETLAAAGATRDPREVVAVTTHGVRVDNERHFGLLRVLVTAAALEATAAETLTCADRVYREALAEVAARLEDLEVLKEGLTRDRAADILWFYLGHQSWRVYVADCGWSWDETEEWLVERVSAAVLSDRTT